MSAADARARRARVLRAMGGRGLALLDELVRAGTTVVDVGASVGLFTTRLAELVGSEGSVDAFEPNPRAFARLEEIAAAAGNVVPHGIALSDRAGIAELHIPIRSGTPLDGLGRIGPGDEPHVERIAVTTARLDDFELSPAFVKCDVEGHELAVLHGAAATLRRSRPILLVEIEHRHAGERMEETFAYLAGLGYEGRALGPDGPVPLSAFDVERHQIAHLGGETGGGRMPPGYVNDFVFTPA